MNENSTRARLLRCGLCYEENGEEVHPHPECREGAGEGAPDLVDTNERLDLDMAVYGLEVKLSLALVRRLTYQVRQTFPEARTVRTYRGDYGRHVVSEICGPHGKVLYSQERDGDLGSRIASDADQIVKLAPPRGRVYVRPRPAPREWSITLQETESRSRNAT